jgi:hypothetical protein
MLVVEVKVGPTNLMLFMNEKWLDQLCENHNHACSKKVARKRLIRKSRTMGSKICKSNSIRKLTR